MPLLTLSGAQKVQKTKVIGLVLVAILATASVGGFVVYAQSTSTSKVPDYIAIAEKTRDQAKELADLAHSKGVNMSRVYALIDRGSQILEEAKTHLANNETARAVSKARVAMQYFTNAIRGVDTLFTREIRKEQIVQGLMNLITRLENRIQKIREEVAASNVSQTVKDEINASLDEAQNHLNLAKEALSDSKPRIEAAAKEIREANHDIYEAVKTFREAIGKRSEAVNLRAGERGRVSERNFDKEIRWNITPGHR